MRNPLKRGPKCDPVPPPAIVIGKGHTSGGPTAVYITADDPLRDTVEKAERYYKLVDMLGNEARLRRANAQDMEAAARLLNA